MFFARQYIKIPADLDPNYPPPPPLKNSCPEHTPRFEEFVDPPLQVEQGHLGDVNGLSIRLFRSMIRSRNPKVSFGLCLRYILVKCIFSVFLGI